MRSKVNLSGKVSTLSLSLKRKEHLVYSRLFYCCPRQEGSLQTSQRIFPLYHMEWIQPVDLKNCASVLIPYLSKLFHLFLSHNTFPSYWKFILNQPLLRKGDRLQPSKYRNIGQLYCLS